MPFKFIQKLSLIKYEKRFQRIQMKQKQFSIYFIIFF